MIPEGFLPNIPGLLLEWIELVSGTLELSAIIINIISSVRMTMELTDNSEATPKSTGC